MSIGLTVCVVVAKVLAVELVVEVCVDELELLDVVRVVVIVVVVDDVLEVAVVVVVTGTFTNAAKNKSPFRAEVMKRQFAY